ncbi:MAG: putative sulfate/molybdate transporter [Candidatus Dadabacteria bacterium]|nr:putative sulfate/molybdate transporter [Candidatus Dadabacteria bacterium]
MQQAFFYVRHNAQILTGVIYGIPMPVQPLKAVAVIAISLNLSGELILGAGLALGLSMLFLTITGLIDWISKVVPNSVIRGIQFGLGINLVFLALNNYIPADGINGYVLSAVSFVLIAILMGNRKLPPALPVVALGVLYAFFSIWNLTYLFMYLVFQFRVSKFQIFKIFLQVLSFSQYLSYHSQYLTTYWQHKRCRKTSFQIGD